MINKSNIVKRKVIKQGNNTLTMTLPRSWTNDFNLQQGDELNIDIRGNNLILSTDNLINFDSKTKDISKLNSILPLVLMSLYRKGYDEIELKFNQANNIIIIQNILKEGTGYHITDHSINSCKLKSLSDVKDVNFNDMLRKLFILIKMKLEKITLAINEKEISGLQSLIAMNTLPAKMTNFCLRLISKGSLKDMAHQYYQIVIGLENLDNQLNIFLSQLLDSSLNLTSKLLISAINEFNDLFVKFYNAFHSSNSYSLVHLMNEKENMATKFHLISDNLNNSENSIFLSLNNGFLHFNEILTAAFIIGL